MAMSTGEAMERPLKRRRLSSTPEYPENDNLEEDDQESTEEWDLQAARAQNDMRLKSIFEGIFSKYGRDFTDVGDEIDLQTGKIVVDNGHLSGMHEEDDAGQDTEGWLHEAASSDEDAAGDQDPYAEDTHGTSDKASGPSTNDETAKSSVNNALVDPGFASRVDKEIKSPIVEAQTVPSIEPFGKDPGPMDPVWQVPELPTLFSTPTAETKRASPKLPKLVREVTPPGSGSLWSVPRRGRPRTEGKPRATPSKSRPRAKRKYHSSPMAHDWSFADTPDGDESDDPLQEYEPSPSKRLIAKTIRGKYMHASAATAGTGQTAHTDSPLSRQPLPDTHTQLPPGQSATKPELSVQDTHAKNDAQNHVALENNYNLHDSCPDRDTHAVSPIPSGNTPAKSPWGLTPDEAKLLVRMRHIQKRSWQDIAASFANRKQQSLCTWNKLHWADRQKSPPPLSSPWTQSERQTLEKLKDKTGLSWHEIVDNFSHRTRPQIEFELMKLWVGDGVELNEKPRAPEPAIQQDEAAEDRSDEPDDHSDEESVERPNEQSDDETDTSDRIIESIEKPSGPIQQSVEKDDAFFNKEQSQSFESFLDQGDDDLPAPSPSRLSSIHLNTPTISRQASRMSRTPKASPTKRLKFTV